jgi:outer membrane protein
LALTTKGGLRATGAALLAMVAMPAWAQEADVPAEPRGDSLTIGLGGAVSPRYDGSDDYRIIPGGVVRGSVSGIDFSLVGLNLYVDLIPNKGNGINIQAGPVIGLGLNRTSRKGIGDAQVRALGKLDVAVELGGYVGIGKTGVITSDYDTLSFSVAYQRDVANAHDSYVITPSINYGTPLSRTTYVGIGVSAEIVGDRYADYNFGVTPAGAIASGLPAYTPEGGLKDISFTLLGAQSLSGDLRGGWSIFAVGSYSKLMGDFKRSPVVAIAGDADQWFGGLGVAYTF